MFANSIDGLQPLLNHLLTRDANDNWHNIPMTKVLAKKAYIEHASPELWELAKDIIEKSTTKGLYSND
jgi:putative hydrolases of HD superfamily